MKRFLSLLLALCMVLAIIPVSARADDVLPEEPELSPEVEPMLLDGEAEPAAQPVTDGVQYIVSSGKCGDNVTWTLDNNGTLTISGSGEMNNYYNDDWHSGQSYSPWHSSNIHEVIIEPGVTRIGNYAFYKCSNLVSVLMPESVTAFGFGAFEGCSSLLSIIIPKSVIEMGGCVFQDCSSLTSVTIPSGVSSIENRSFSGCTGLTSVTIPKNVKSIGYSAFYNCSLSDVFYSGNTIRWSCIAIEVNNDPLNNAEIHFSETNDGEITSGTCGENVTWVLDDTGTVTISGTGAITDSPWRSYSQAVFTVVIEPGVTEIGTGAFYACRSLTNVTIPLSMTDIGSDAFGFCTALTDVYYGGMEEQWGKITVGNGNDPLLNATIHCQPATPDPAIYTVTFDANGGTGEMDAVTVTEGEQLTLPECGFEAPEGKEFDTWNAGDPGDTIDVTGDMTVTALWKDKPHDPSSNIAEGTCGDNLTWTLDENGVLTISGTGSIPEYTNIHSNGSMYSSNAPWYQYHSSILTIVIENGVTGIGAHAFFGCENTTDAIIADSVEELEWGAFYGCSSLSYVSVPSSVTKFGSEVFSGCNLLITAGPVGSGSNYEFGWTSLIPAHAFEQCSSLIQIDLPNSIVGIGSYAFSYCSNMPEIILPDGIVSIADSAFNHCISLKNVILPEGIIRIGSGAFENCISFTEIIIPNSITKIEGWTFISCSGLKEISIPESVTEIGQYAFCSCISLADVYYGGNEGYWNAVSIASDNEPLLNATIHFGSAIPDPVFYTVTFDANGGAGEMDAVTVTEGEQLTLPECGFEAPEGKEFDTWDAGDPGDTIDVTGDMTVTALWKDKSPYVAEGACGDNLTWTMDDGGVLVLDGEGEMPDFIYDSSTGSTAPWGDHLDDIQQVILASGITKIGANAFRGCVGLTDVTIPDSVTSIGEGAFRACGTLTSVELPSALTSIGAYAFAYCYALPSINIPEGVVSIGDHAFHVCRALTEITIPSAVTVIEANTFYSCTALASVTLPNTLVSVKSNAFNKCTALADVWYQGSQAQWDGISIASGNAPLQNAAIHLIEAPTITEQPLDQQLEEDAVATFHVASSGSDLSYQWYSRASSEDEWQVMDTEDAQTDTIIVQAISGADGSQYRCCVSNSFGSVFSQPATLTVILRMPVITGQPESLSVDAGKTASFTVTATGSCLSYQWYEMSEGEDWAAITGETSETLSFKATLQHSGRQYRCEVSNRAGSVFSDAAALSVNAVSKPKVTEQPVSKTAPDGRAVAFSVTATGGGLTYQWYKKPTNTTWSAISGATSSTLTIVAAEKLNGYQYRCKVSNSAGGVYSSAATLTVTEAKPAVTTPPVSVTVKAGSSAKFSVTATGGWLTYQWYKKSASGAWSAVSGATSATLTITATEKLNGYQYRCKVKNSVGSLYSAAATLTVTGGKPKITQQPASVTAEAGQTATFFVTATGEDLIYQWYRKSAKGTWSAISGATEPTLTVAVTVKLDGYQYRCKVKNSSGSVYTSIATLCVSSLVS